MRPRRPESWLMTTKPNRRVRAIGSSACQIACADKASSCDVISSQIKIRVDGSKKRASEMRASSPPDTSRAKRSSHAGLIPSAAWISGSTSDPLFRTSRNRQRGSTASSGDCGTCWIGLGGDGNGALFHNTCPASGRSAPDKMRASVDLPTPDGPEMPRISPSATSSDRSCRTVRPRKAWLKPVALSTPVPNAVPPTTCG